MQFEHFDEGLMDIVVKKGTIANIKLINNDFLASMNGELDDLLEDHMEKYLMRSFENEPDWSDFMLEDIENFILNKEDFILLT